MATKQVPWPEAFRDQLPLEVWGGRPIRSVQHVSPGEFHGSTPGPFGRIALFADTVVDVLVDDEEDQDAPLARWEITSFPGGSEVITEIEMRWWEPFAVTPDASAPHQPYRVWVRKKV